MIGLKRGVVQLKKYNPKWKELFDKESELILSVSANLLVEIQHIGSTAIPGIVAKPIIDILAGINSLSNIEKLIENLEPLGYVYRGEQGIPDRHLFVKGGEDFRTHHLHVVEKEHPEWSKHILFRNYLLKHPEEVDAYSNLKRELLQQYEFDRGMYTDSKSDFILGVLEKARKEFSV